MDHRTPQRGRPPLPASARKSASLTVRLGTSDVQALASAAQCLAVSDGEVVRRALHALAQELAL